MSRTDPVPRLRQLLLNLSIDGYLVPSEDSHQSEYPVAADARREYISGFTGSAGYALITLNNCYLWTDGRYHIQAAAQLDSNTWTLQKLGVSGCQSLQSVIEKEVKHLGYDPYVYTAQGLAETFKNLSNMIEMIPIHSSDSSGSQRNLIDEVWMSFGTRPPYPEGPLSVMDDKDAGESVSSKIARIRATLQDKSMQLLVLASLDQIAWVTNLRGTDVECSRVFLSYLVIGEDFVKLYLRNHDKPDRLGDDVKGHLYRNAIEVVDYTQLTFDLTEMLKDTNISVWIDSKVNLGVSHVVSKSANKSINEAGPVAMMKSIKNSAELKGMQNAHTADAVAMIFWLTWLSKQTINSLITHTEVSVADVLQALRASQATFKSLSFPTIAGIGSNGAIIHYRASNDTAKKLDPNAMFLVDSGAHYTGGTTDITRTVHLGVPSRFEREMYTRVLMGHIDLATATFIHGTVGGGLDILARQHLYEIGYDYLHGTGHGVGHSLEVHEGPPVISRSCNDYNSRDAIIQPGMIVSNEPGAYFPDQFGIRIENLMFCKEITTPMKFNNAKFYGFQQLTLVPYCRKLIDTALLTKKQRVAIDNYHNQIIETVLPIIKESDDFAYNLQVDSTADSYITIKISRKDVIDWLTTACDKL